MADTYVVFPRAGTAELAEQTRLVPARGELLLRTRYSLMSPGTELALYLGTHVSFPDPQIKAVKYPIRPGYATIGEVVAAGPEQGPGAPKLGDLVLHCGRHSSWNLLNPRQDLWVPLPAVPVQPRLLLGRMAQISATALHSVRARPEKVLVLGAGLVGIFAAQVFGLNGARLVVIQDLSPRRLERAFACGLRQQVLASADPDVRLCEFFGEAGPDVVIEATGVPQLVPDALRWVRRGGDVILLGSPRGNQEINLYKHVHGKCIALIGAHESALPSHADAPRPSRQALLTWAVKGVADGALCTDGLLTHEITPGEVPEVYRAMATERDRYLGVVIRWA